MKGVSKHKVILSMKESSSILCINKWWMPKKCLLNIPNWPPKSRRCFQAVCIRHIVGTTGLALLSPQGMLGFFEHYQQNCEPQMHLHVPEKWHKNTHHFVYKIPLKSMLKRLTLWGLGTWNFTSPRDYALFGDFLFFQTSLLFVIVANSPHYSPYCKSTCPSDHNVIFCFAPPSSWCSKWHHNDATMMLQQKDIYVLPVP